MQELRRRQDWLEEVRANGFSLEDAPEGLRADKEVVLAAVQQEGVALRFASEGLRADREVVVAAVKKIGLALEYASEDFRADKEVVLAAVQENGSALTFASEDFRADREVVLAAVKESAYALRSASEDLRADREVVLAAVKRRGEALRFASEGLRADKEFVLEAVQQHGQALLYASEELRCDGAFLLQLVEATKAYWLYEFAAEGLRQDVDFQQRCRGAAGSGLVWTYYHSLTMFLDMRKRFPATGASIPGGAAYDAVMEQLKEADHGGRLATCSALRGEGVRSLRGASLRRCWVGFCYVGDRFLAVSVLAPVRSRAFKRQTGQ